MRRARDDLPVGFVNNDQPIGETLGYWRNDSNQDQSSQERDKAFHEALDGGSQEILPMTNHKVVAGAVGERHDTARLALSEPGDP